MQIKLSKPFTRSMNSEPISEIELDFDKLTAKNYIDSFHNQDGNELELIAYGKLGFLQAKNLIANAVDCVPEMLDDLSIMDYRAIEKECFAWFFGAVYNNETPKATFENLGVKDYLAIRSRNAINDGDSLTNKASAKTRESIISFITKKPINEVEAMPIKDYIPLDIQCASFFSELV